MSARPTGSPLSDVPAVEACKDLELPEAARALMAPGMSARAYAQALLDEGHAGEAVDVLARWLPARHAVHWCTLVVRAAAGPDAPREVDPALAAAERWVSDPSEPNRRGAEKAAEAGGYRTPAALAAAGAFFSGGNLAPESSGAKVAPGPDLTPRTVSGSVRIAAVEREPEKAVEKLRDFASLGLDVAAGRRRWGAD